jgi:FAD synthase
MNDTQHISILIEQSPLEMFNQINRLKKLNEELQSIDSLQQTIIEKLNKEVYNLRESLFLLEQQYNKYIRQQSKT